MNIDTDDPRIQAAARFAAQHDLDPEHAHQVCKTALVLFDALRDLHGLSDRERVLLHAAALMHDTGYDNRPAQHHKGSRDLILRADLEGFSQRERMMLACIARYHRKAGPQPGHKVYCDLDGPAQAIIGKLAAILRVADGLDRSHAMSLQSLRTEQHGDTVTIYVIQRVANSVDLATARRKAGLFEEVFGVTLEVVLEP